MVIIKRHGPRTRLLKFPLLSPRHIPHVGRLVEERCLIPLISASARDPFVSSTVSRTSVAAAGVGPIPPIVVFAAVADRKTPLAR